MKELDGEAPASVSGAANVAASGAQGVKPGPMAAVGRRRGSSDDEDAVIVEGGGPAVGGGKGSARKKKGKK